MTSRPVMHQRSITLIRTAGRSPGREAVTRCTLDDATETRNQFHLGHPLNFNPI